MTTFFGDRDSIKLMFDSKTKLLLRLEKLRVSAIGRTRKNCIESNEFVSKNGLVDHIKREFSRQVFQIQYRHQQ